MHRLNESRPGSTSPDICNRPSGTSYPLYHPANLYYRPPIDMKHTPGVSTNHSLNSKPRIWSLADMASKEEKHPSDAKLTPPSALPGLYPSSAGKIVSPLPSRMHYPPFFKPRDAVVSSIFSPFFLSMRCKRIFNEVIVLCWWWNIYQATHFTPIYPSNIFIVFLLFSILSSSSSIIFFIMIQSYSTP